jgi:ribosomal protein S18 acetylase RimI-like enzyme
MGFSSAPRQEEQVRITARLAQVSDLGVLEGLYRGLEAEMTALHPMWPLADGLPLLVSDALAEAVRDGNSVLGVGEIDGYPLGFILARVEELLPQAHGDLLGSIRLVYVDEAAREVGLGEAMRDLVLERLRGMGIRRFDAHVLPGHRLAKNFFEAGGFAARSIVMHRRNG